MESTFEEVRNSTESPPSRWKGNEAIEYTANKSRNTKMGRRRTSTSGRHSRIDYSPVHVHAPGDISFSRFFRDGRPWNCEQAPLPRMQNTMDRVIRSFRGVRRGFHRHVSKGTVMRGCWTDGRREGLQRARATKGMR